MATQSLISDLRLLRKLFSLTHVSYLRCLGSFFLAVIATGFEGLSYVLLVPTIHSLIVRNVHFIRNVSYFEKISVLLPESWSATDAQLLFTLIGFIFLIQGFKNLTQAFFNKNVMTQTQCFTSGLRSLIYERYLAFGKPFFDKHSVGALQHTLTTYPKIIAQSLKTIQQAFYTAAIVVLSLAVMAKISWFLTLIVILAAPILNFSVIGFSKKIRRTSRAAAKANSVLARSVGAALSCMMLIKACSTEAMEKARLAQPGQNADRQAASVAWKQFLIGPIQETLGLALIFLLLFFMTHSLLTDSSGNAAAYLVFFIILRRLTPKLNFISKLNTSIAAMHGPLQDIESLLFGGYGYIIPDGSEPFPGLRSRISVRNLSFQYPEAAGRVLNEVSLEMPQGTMTALVGPTGAGKTTLIHLLMRFYASPQDSIFVDDVDLSHFNLKTYHHKIAFVSQDCLLFDETIRYNLNYGCPGEASDTELLSALQKARLADLIGKLPRGLDSLIGDRGVRLSGGERQRLAIARAFLRKAEILILDEATSALDGETERLIQEAIMEVTQGRTTLVVAHRFSTIRGADHIVVLEEGHVVEEGSLKNLLELKGLFWKLWEAQRFY